MDFYTECPEKPSSHYESVAFKENRNTTLENVKSNAFYCMHHLEGWCSKNKASILIDLIFMIEPQTIVEVGVFGGKSLVPMACALKEIKKGTVYGIDPWNTLDSVKGMEGEHYEWWHQIDHELVLRNLENKIWQFDLYRQIVLIRSTSEDAPSICNIDILHIDGNHSEEASMLDVTKWVALVRKGGIIVLDDINWENDVWKTNESAVKWMDCHCIRIATFDEDNHWGIWVKP